MQSIPESRRKYCGERLGEALWYALQDNFLEIVRGCEKGHNFEMVQSCILGVNRTGINGPDGSLGDVGIKICGALSPRYRPFCYSDLGRLIREQYGEDFKDEFCAKVKGSGGEFCFVG